MYILHVYVCIYITHHTTVKIIICRSYFTRQFNNIASRIHYWLVSNYNNSDPVHLHITTALMCISCYYYYIYYRNNSHETYK